MFFDFNLNNQWYKFLLVHCRPFYILINSLYNYNNNKKMLKIKEYKIYQQNLHDGTCSVKLLENFSKKGW